MTKPDAHSAIGAAFLVSVKLTLFTSLHMQKSNPGCGLLSCAGIEPAVTPALRQARAPAVVRCVLKQSAQ